LARARGLGSPALAARTPDEMNGGHRS
jgi:hypothetical protein